MDARLDRDTGPLTVKLGHIYVYVYVNCIVLSTSRVRKREKKKNTIERISRSSFEVYKQERECKAIA